MGRLVGTAANVEKEAIRPIAMRLRGRIDFIEGEGLRWTPIIGQQIGYIKWWVTGPRKMAWPAPRTGAEELAAGAGPFP